MYILHLQLLCQLLILCSSPPLFRRTAANLLSLSLLQEKVIIFLSIPALPISIDVGPRFLDQLFG
jgi:hypothetical protein